MKNSYLTPEVVVYNVAAEKGYSDSVLLPIFGVIADDFYSEEQL